MLRALAVNGFLVIFVVAALASCRNGDEGRRAGAADEDSAPRSPVGAVREPAVAGAFYPARKSALEADVKKLLAGVPAEKVDGRIVGLLSPHAGYAYSGKTAAYGYRLLEGKGFTRVVVLAPAHYAGFRGASIPDVGAYRTPLGLVPLDMDACRELLGHELYTSRADAHSREHSLEVQLPFLQEALGEFTLVPIVVGQVGGDDYKKLAAPLRKLLDEKTILIVSTDFTHYGRRFGYVPFTENVRENLEKLDGGAIGEIENMDARGFLSYQEKTGATICGRCPVGVFLTALPTDARATLLKYETSGDVTGDYSSSVSYVSMVITVPGAR